jgi:molecular chaperone DnaK (HSP70)
MSNNHVEIIGFDLGHGETALTKILGNDPNSAPVKLLLHKKDCQPTMIAYHPEQGVLFGKPALALKATDFQIAFKKRPTSDSNYQKVMKDYVKAIYDHLLQTDQLKKDDQNHFFIGCPSEWSDANRSEYQKLLKSFNLPGFGVSVIEESFAALMQAVKSELLTTEDIKGNVLVIDVGSSTTDCTLVKAGIHEEDGDFGIDLGAALIDKAILYYSLSKNEDKEEIESAFKKINLHRHRCEFQCREAKEEYFCYSLQYIDEDSSVPTKTYKIPGTGNFDPIIYKEIIERIISQPLEICLPNYQEILPSLPTVNFQKSWKDNFHDFLMTTKQELEAKGVKVNTILFTGGASKMDFIPEIVHKIFPNCKCTKDTEPSFCIAMGLARWGKKSINSIHFTEEVEQFLQNDLPKIFTTKIDISPWKGSSISWIPLYGTPIDSLRSKLTEELVDGLSYKVVKPVLFDWRNRNGINTIKYGLEPEIISRTKKWLEGTEGQEIIKKAINDWIIKDIVPPLKEKTDLICNKYHLGLGQIVPPSLNYNPDVDKLGTTTVNITDPTLFTAIVNWIIGTITVVITLFLATTIIGLIIGLVVMFGLQGWAEDTIKESDIPKWIRKGVSDKKISEMTDQIKEKLKEEVGKSIAEDKQFMDKFLYPVKDWLSKEVKEQADSVKILIS